MKTVNVLGQPYQITVKKYDEDEAFERRSICGYCDDLQKLIVVCDLSTAKNWKNEPKETCEIAQKRTMRHEIVHAFLTESGLEGSAHDSEAWAVDEEIVDWITWQGPKIYAAWKEADAL